MKLGRFELKRVLGEGAQATVWLGFDARLERDVAVKLMREQAAADPFAVNQWLQEARSVSRLTHTNIVPVFAAIRFEDVHFQYPGAVDEALRGFDLEVHAGQTVALVGETGAGKSTI